MAFARGDTGSGGAGMGRSGAALRLALEGNIAVGKSTFLRLLGRAFPAWQRAAEPVARWREVAAGAAEGGNLLQRLYRDPARWAFTFQTFSCLGRLQAQLEQPEGPVRVSERSVYSDRYVFAKSLFEGGQLDALEWAVYQEWHTFLVGQLGAHTAPHAFLYLRASPQRCLERLRCRARPEERDVTLQYLQQLHAQHERWLLERSAEVHFAEVRHVPVLVLDVEGDFEHDAAAQDALMARVGRGFREGAARRSSTTTPRGQMSPVATRMGTQLALLLGPELHSLQQHCAYPRGRWELQLYTCHRFPPYICSAAQGEHAWVHSNGKQRRKKKKTKQKSLLLFVFRVQQNPDAFLFVFSFYFLLETKSVTQLFSASSKGEMWGHLTVQKMRCT
ncbi:deoxyguanosine kinase, mitochondrial isoform X2 [Tympanuchus pallidicinctus]|uniref:deoxyguanosine kinase, mitochondrial isoform X2 n=1 Tax=Tympanuchus pallidicinctus TaxID=109042 RepID=UPI00228747CC|nr:deoxyguanosine kinase, mitochondrial isoform X2 [Tympanuchus pallidicinctus]